MSPFGVPGRREREPLKTSGEIWLRGACESRPGRHSGTRTISEETRLRRNALFRFFESRRAALSSTVHPKRRPRYTHTSQSSTWSRAPPPPPPPPRASPPPRTRATPRDEAAGADTSRRRTRRASPVLLLRASSRDPRRTALVSARVLCGGRECAVEAPSRGFCGASAAKPPEIAPHKKRRSWDHILVSASTTWYILTGESGVR